MTDGDRTDTDRIHGMLEDLERFRKERGVISSQELGRTRFWRHVIREDRLMISAFDGDWPQDEADPTVCARSADAICILDLRDIDPFLVMGADPDDDARHPLVLKTRPTVMPAPCRIHNGAYRLRSGMWMHVAMTARMHTRRHPVHRTGARSGLLCMQPRSRNQHRRER